MNSQTAARTLILGRTDDFPESGLREVEAQGKKLLLVKSGDTITCIAATCPHNGAPLAQGIQHGGTVICPWHKAAFAAGSGKCLEPPALEDLAAYELSIIDGDILLGPEKIPAKPAPQSSPGHIAILGGGAAGFSAAAELRAQNFTGQITLIDKSAGLPSDRTALSKAVLAGQKPLEKTALKPESFFKSHNITRREGEVAALDPTTRSIAFTDGSSLPYDTALIATGGTPRTLPVPGAALKNIFVLRAPADVTAVIAAAETTRHAVIVGTGFIGMEAAAALRERGLDVTVIGEEAAPLASVLGAKIGRVIQSLHEDHGVKFILNAKVTKFNGTGSVKSVELDSGESLKADLVITGLGIQPATGFIKGLPLEPDGAIAVDKSLQAATHLFAAGDVAKFPYLGNEDHKIRIEHWRVAEQQGRLAASAMLGGKPSYNAAPYFWTMHFKKRLDYVGHAKGTDETTIRGDFAAQKFIAYYLENGEVAAAAGMNENQNIAALIILMAQKSWRLDDLHPTGSSPLAVLKSA